MTSQRSLLTGPRNRDERRALARALLRDPGFALRDYQVRALEMVREAWRGGARSIVLVMPTGAGKTSTGVIFIRGTVERGGRALVIVHRRELAGQWFDRLLASGFPRELLGVVMAGDARDNPDALVQIGSVQTLLARGERPGAEVVLWDEGHHVVAESFREVGAAYPDATHLLLTATPERSDGAALNHVAQAMVAPVSMSELLRGGYLVGCNVVAPPKVLADGLAMDPLEAVQKHAGGRPTIVFCANVAAARDLAARCNAAGIAAACVDGETDLERRAADLARFARGELQVLTNVHVLTEGFDCPRAEVCVLARGCGSAATFLQMVGRVLRPHPGKSRALLVDLTGAVHAHGLPTDDRHYSLDGEPITSKAKRVPLRTCAECWAVFRVRPACPQCGATYPVPKAPAVRPVALKIVERPVVTFNEKRAEWVRLCAVAAHHGFKPAWAFIRFKETFGHAPPRNFPKFHEVAA